MLKLKVDQSYDDLWRSIGHCVAVSAILVTAVDFYYFAATLFVFVIALKTYECMYKVEVRKDINVNKVPSETKPPTVRFETKPLLKENNGRSRGRKRLLRRTSSCPDIAELNALHQSVQQPKSFTHKKTPSHPLRDRHASRR